MIEWLKGRITKGASPHAPIEEDTLDRYQLLKQSKTRVRRAQELRRRSEEVDATLKDQNLRNHYSERIGRAYGKPRGA